MKLNIRHCGRVVNTYTVHSPTPAHCPYHCLSQLSSLDQEREDPSDPCTVTQLESDSSIYCCNLPEILAPPGSTCILLQPLLLCSPDRETLVKIKLVKVAQVSCIKILRTFRNCLQKNMKKLLFLPEIQTKLTKFFGKFWNVFIQNLQFFQQWLKHEIHLFWNQTWTTLMSRPVSAASCSRTCLAGLGLVL